MAHSGPSRNSGPVCPNRTTFGRERDENKVFFLLSPCGDSSLLAIPCSGLTSSLLSLHFLRSRYQPPLVSVLLAELLNTCVNWVNESNEWMNHLLFILWWEKPYRNWMGHDLLWVHFYRCDQASEERVYLKLNGFRGQVHEHLGGEHGVRQDGMPLEQ